MSVTSLYWQPLPADPSGAKVATQPGWYRARLPHGWLVTCLTESRTMVNGRTMVADEGYPACVSTTFVPLGPAPWN